jgi:hypothetical protein
MAFNRMLRYVVVPAVGVAALLTGCSSNTPTSSAAPPATSGTVPSKFIDANTADLTGTWKSENRHYDIKGERGSGSESITITDQKDGLFKATRSITVGVPANFGDGKGDQTTATFPSAGVINPDGTITMVKSGDSGMLNAWLIDRDHMEAVYVESGDEQVVVRQTLRRS